MSQCATMFRNRGAKDWLWGKSFEKGQVMQWVNVLY